MRAPSGVGNNTNGSLDTTARDSFTSLHPPPPAPPVIVRWRGWNVAVWQYARSNSSEHQPAPAHQRPWLPYPEQALDKRRGGGSWGKGGPSSHNRAYAFLMVCVGGWVGVGG